MKKLLTLALGVAVLAAFTSLSAALDKASPKLMTCNVTQVDQKAKTFAVTSKGQTYAVNGSKLKALPSVGAIIDLTYTGNPGGPMEAVTVKGSKSNSDN